MTVNSLKDLDKLLKLLRTQGVKTFELGDMKLELNETIVYNKPLKLKHSLHSAQDNFDSLTNISASVPVPQPEIPTDGPTAEELLFWSTGEQPSEQQ